jgi:hypothetical protein
VKLAKKRGLKLEFTDNSADWLDGKAGVNKHASKLRYAVRHLLRDGSDFRISADETPFWVGRSWTAFFGSRG